MSNSQKNTEMQELEPVRVLTLEDESGAKLPVEVVVEIEQDDDVYVLLTPAEPLVMVLREDRTNEDATLEALDSSEFQAVKKHIHDALIQHNVSINVKGDDFVLIGEPKESFYASCSVSPKIRMPAQSAGKISQRRLFHYFFLHHRHNPSVGLAPLRSVIGGNGVFLTIAHGRNAVCSNAMHTH